MKQSNARYYHYTSRANSSSISFYPFLKLMSPIRSLSITYSVSFSKFISSLCSLYRYVISPLKRPFSWANYLIISDRAGVSVLFKTYNFSGVASIVVDNPLLRAISILINESAGGLSNIRDWRRVLNRVHLNIIIVLRMVNEFNLGVYSSLILLPQRGRKFWVRIKPETASRRIYN